MPPPSGSFSARSRERRQRGVACKQGLIGSSGLRALGGLIISRKINGENMKIILPRCQIGTLDGLLSTSHFRLTDIPSTIGIPKPGSRVMANDGVSATKRGGWMRKSSQLHCGGKKMLRAYSLLRRGDLVRHSTGAAGAATFCRAGIGMQLFVTLHFRRGWLYILIDVIGFLKIHEQTYIAALPIYAIN